MEFKLLTDFYLFDKVGTMSKINASKVSATLASLFLLASVAFPVMAQNATTGASLRKPAIPQKINIRQEKVASKTAALKLKLQTFKDQNKAKIADRLNTNLNKINQNQTAQMQRNLDTMSNILDKLETRTNQGSPDAIASARATIATTSAAVTAQAQKDYTISVTTEKRIKVDAKAMRDKLHLDLRTTRKAVIDAKQQVANSIRMAKSNKEATSSGQQ